MSSSPSSATDPWTVAVASRFSTSSGFWSSAWPPWMRTENGTALPRLVVPPRLTFPFNPGDGRDQRRGHLGDQVLAVEDPVLERPLDRPVEGALDGLGGLPLAGEPHRRVQLAGEHLAVGPGGEGGGGLHALDAGDHRERPARPAPGAPASRPGSRSPPQAPKRPSASVTSSPFTSTVARRSVTLWRRTTASPTRSVARPDRPAKGEAAPFPAAVAGCAGPVDGVEGSSSRSASSRSMAAARSKRVDPGAVSTVPWASRLMSSERQRERGDLQGLRRSGGPAGARHLHREAIARLLGQRPPGTQVEAGQVALGVEAERAAGPAPEAGGQGQPAAGRLLDPLREGEPDRRQVGAELDDRPRRAAGRLQDEADGAGRRPAEEPGERRVVGRQRRQVQVACHHPQPLDAGVVREQPAHLPLPFQGPRARRRSGAGRWRGPPSPRRR